MPSVKELKERFEKGVKDQPSQPLKEKPGKILPPASTNPSPEDILSANYRGGRRKTRRRKTRSRR